MRDSRITAGICVAIILLFSLLSGCQTFTGKPKLPKWKAECEFCRSKEAHWMLKDMGILFPATAEDE